MDEAAVVEEAGDAQPAAPAPRRTAYRHRLPTRIWHWVNALTVIVMLMSGLMILNAHPRLYWGVYGANFDHAWLSLGYRPFPGWATIPSSKPFHSTPFSRSGFASIPSPGKFPRG